VDPVTRVLVVDDEPACRLALVRLLRALGVEVEAVHSGASALEVLTQQRFDLAIVDFLMSPMTGLELVAEMERRGVTCRVAMVSGVDRSELEARVAAAGADRIMALLGKPIWASELAALLARLARATCG
jgi:two-component system response regulator MprA